MDDFLSQPPPNDEGLAEEPAVLPPATKPLPEDPSNQPHVAEESLLAKTGERQSNKSLVIRPNDLPAEAPSSFLGKMLWVLAFLILLLLLPLLVGQVRYAYVYNAERAKFDAAEVGLQKLKMSDLSLAFRNVAKKIGPSAVSIQTQRIERSATVSDEQQYYFPRKRSEVGQGSGVVIDKNGYIITNHHVVDGASEIVVRFSDGSEEYAEIIGTDSLTDLAVLKVNRTDLLPLEWGDSKELDVGSMVWAVGSPFGLESSISFGVISAKNRRGVTRSIHQNFLQSDVAVNPGNSGGPLIDITGKIVGINTAIMGDTYQGISFAIPSNEAQNIYEHLRSEGKISRGWLGVELMNVNSEIAKQLKLKKAAGVIARRIVVDSPADLAGLQPWDVVIRWNGIECSDRTALSRLVAKTKIGSTAKADIIRDGKELTLDIAIKERPVRFQ